MRRVLWTTLFLMSWGLPWAPVNWAQETQPPTPAPSNAEDEASSEEKKPLGTITQIQFKGITTLNPEVVADVATLEVGDTLTRQKLENSINDLRKWGVFSKVEVIVAYTDQGVDLYYDLVEGYIIKAIHIKGNFPILESKVNRAMFLSPGRIYNSEKLPEQVDRLDKLYENEGYFGTTVLAIEDYNEENHQVTLFFRIKKGTIYRMRKVDVEGNTVFYGDRIKNIIFTYARFKPKELKEDLQKISKLYNRKGFVRARVRVGSELFDYDAKKVDLEILIREGPRVKVEFEGNKRIRKRTLKKNITIYEGGDFDEFELDASVKQLKRFYLQRGFEEVQISWERKKLNKEYFLIIFKIKEGPQRKVAAIDFIGNEHIESDKLRELMRTKVSGFLRPAYYYQRLFAQDLETIEEFYREQGFLHAKVSHWDKTYSANGKKVYLTVNIQEEPQAKVESLSLQGLSTEQTQQIRPKLLLQPGAFYSPARVKKDIQTILVNLANDGYPYAEVKQDAAQTQPNVFKVSYQIIPGKRVKIGRVLFVGNALTKESVLRKNMRIKEGDWFSTQKILQSQINIRGLGAFNAVGIDTLGLTSEREEVNLVVRVEEKKDKIIDVEAGYNTDLGFSGKVIFNKLNIWGSGKNFNTKVQVGNQVNRLELNYIDPRLMGSSLQLTTGVFGGIERRPFFRSNNVGGYGSVFKRIFPRLSAFGRLDFGLADVDTSNTVFAKIDPRGVPNARTRLATTLGITYDTRDNFGDPRSGIYNNATASLTNQFIQIGGNYATLRNNFGYWYSPFSRVTIANALRVASIQKIPGNTNVPADDRLYLGGDTTVRGFKQDALLPSGGTFSLVHNLELQIRVIGQVMVVGFLDSGVVTNSISEVSLTTLRHSAGPGIRYLTPVGPIRLDWGFVLDPEPGDATSNRIHFSFGYFF